MAVINPDLASVFDEGEIYVLDPTYTGTIDAATPAAGQTPGSMWLDFGLLGTEGVTYTPGLEKAFYDGWGHPRFKGKTSKGTLELSFPALELNHVTNEIAHGVDAGYISVPKGLHRHLLIITREDDIEEIEVTRRPALLTTGAWTKSEAGVRTYPITADIFPDGDRHLFKLIKSGGVESITVTPATASIAVGATRQLAVADQDSDALTSGVAFSSSDATKATVSSGGLVTGVAAGSATITASYGGKTATCAVTVTA